MEYKRCSNCENIFHVSCFKESETFPDGLKPHCEECEMKLLIKEWEKFFETQRKKK